MEKIKLTQYSHGAGCGCKISPEVLKKILSHKDEFPPHPNLVVGNDTNDDAAVFDIGNGQLLISTTDFFMPVVDDAYDFGRIAATNAISDVYAMGGKPILAVAILGWPVEKLPAEIAQQVLEGARFICRIAGIPLAGGHSIDSPEPIFGLAVNGIVKKGHLKQNNTAKENDLLFITKPLGLGMITTAAKRGMAKEEDLETAIRYMCNLNRFGAALGEMDGVHALTDITGFGLLGHVVEMAEGSGLSAEIQFEKVPKIPGLDHYLSQMIYPDMTMKNYSAFSSKVNTLNAQQLFVLCDPQTSGGLLVAVDPGSASEFVAAANDYGLGEIASTAVGRMICKSDKTVNVN